MQPHKTQIEKGDVYNRLTFLKEVEPYIAANGKKQRTGRFLCSCGTKIETRISYVINNRSMSCGCHRIDRTKEVNTKHGLSQGSTEVLYKRWISMHRRCYVKSSKSYRRYGGRGITVAKIWHGKEGLARFIDWSIVNGYHSSLELDRKNNDKGYSPKNCRFITRKRNQNNRNVTVMVLIPKTGRRVSFKELYDRKPRPCSYLSAKHRHLNLGWSLKKSLTVPSARKSSRFRTIPKPLKKDVNKKSTANLVVKI